MSTSTTKQTSSTRDHSRKIAVGDQAYFRERARNEIHEDLVRRFLEHSKATGLTKADMVRALNIKPEQLTRWLTAPGNLTIDTISDLLFAMGDYCTGLKIGEIDVNPAAEAP